MKSRKVEQTVCVITHNGGTFPTNNTTNTFALSVITIKNASRAHR